MDLTRDDVEFKTGESASEPEEVVA
jgi:hypothetical protein